MNHTDTVFMAFDKDVCLMTPIGPRGGEISLMGRKGSGTKFSKLNVKAKSLKNLFRRKDGRLIVLAAGRLHLLEKRTPG